MRGLLAACLILASPAIAQEKVDCENAMSQNDMTLCAGMDFEAADTELNAVWKEVRAAAKAEDAEAKDGRSADEALLSGQRGWIAYRDGQCELAGFEARGGSMEPMLVSGCMAELTRVRTKELRSYVSGDPQ